MMHELRLLQLEECDGPSSFQLRFNVWINIDAIISIHTHPAGAAIYLRGDADSPRIVARTPSEIFSDLGTVLTLFGR